MQQHEQPKKPTFTDTLFGTFNYTRQDALAQGILVDVTGQAKRFSYPCAVAISQMLFEQCVKWDHFDSACQIHQDQDNRLSALLTVTRAAIRRAGFAKTENCFALSVLPKDGYSLQKQAKQLRVVLDKDEHNQPVLTIMLADDLHQALLDFNRNAQESMNGVAS